MFGRPLVLLALITVVTAPAVGRPEATAIRRIVAAGQPAPGGGTFEHFSVESLPVVVPVNSKGQVVFFATLLRARASEGIFLASPTQIVKIAADGDPAPGGGKISGFGRHPIPSLNERGEVAFAAAVVGGKTVEGIFLWTRRRLEPVALAGSAAPGVPSGTLANVDSPALNDHGDIAFLATIRRGRESLEAIYTRSGGRFRKVVLQGDAGPAGGTFAGFGVPSLANNGAVAFPAIIEGRAAPGGVFVAEQGRLRMLAAAGDSTPLGGVFAKFSDRVAINDRGAVVFNSVLMNAPTEGAIFMVDRERVRKIAALGDDAPGGGVFSNFALWPAFNRTGAVGFIASLDSGPTAVAAFVAAGPEIVKVAAIGDTLPGGEKLSSFGLYPVVAMSPAGGVTFATAPTATGEGAEGIFVVNPAPAR